MWSLEGQDFWNCSSFKSTDHFPPPYIIKSMSKTVKEKSVLYSCANVQKPLVVSKGNLVVIKAVIIMINKGIDASLVKNPNKIIVPHNISNAPVKYAQKKASLKPISLKKAGPTTSRYRYFWIPSEIKIKPIINLRKMIFLSVSVFRICDLMLFAVFMIVGSDC